MATRKKARKVPLRVVRGDSYATVIDGETYHPFEGETVSFKRGFPYQAAQDSLKLARLETMLQRDELDAAGYDMMDTLTQALLNQLADSIHSWTFTDEEGERFPAPTREFVRQLDYDLVIWLMQRWRSGDPARGVSGGDVDDMGNGSTPSTDS